MTDENIKKFQEWLTNECRPQLSEDGCYMIEQEPQGTSDFRLQSQGPGRLGTGESGLVVG